MARPSIHGIVNAPAADRAAELRRQSPPACARWRKEATLAGRSVTLQCAAPSQGCARHWDACPPSMRPRAIGRSRRNSWPSMVRSPGVWPTSDWGSPQWRPAMCVTPGGCRPRSAVPRPQNLFEWRSWTVIVGRGWTPASPMHCRWPLPGCGMPDMSSRSPKRPRSRRPRSCGRCWCSTKRSSQ